MKEEKVYNNTYFEKKEDDEINLREVFEKYIFNWKWFVLGFFIALFIAFLYLRYTPNEFAASTTIFINDEETGGMTTELSAFQDLGLISGSKVSIINEIGVLQSRTLIKRVVENLRLNVTYYGYGKIRNRELYKTEVPFKIKFFLADSILYSLDTSFMISAKSKSRFYLKNIENDKVRELRFGKNFSTEFGEINVIPADVENIELDKNIIVKITPVKSVVDNYLDKIEIEPKTKNSSLLIVSLTDQVKQKAKNILDDLIIQYNNDAISYKNQITKNTDKFVSERIADISKNLSEVDKGVEEYKIKNRLTDIEFEANLVLSSNSELGKQIVDLKSQIKLVDYVSDYVNNNKDDLIPANLGLKDDATNTNTLMYNQLLLERNRIMKNSSNINPTVINLNAQIVKLRQSIRQSLSNLRSSLEFSLRELRNQENRLNRKRNIAPIQEREFQDIKRKQQIIETLYLYLLQKREENAMSMGVPIPNAKIIDKANGSDIPVAPRRVLVYVISVVLGLLIPLTIITIISILNNKVQTVEEVEKIINVPVLGDIPKTKSEHKIVVDENERTSVAEAFRLLRTNLHYMFSGVSEKSKSIFITSTVGGEGKTFIGINLASVLSSTNKKVLLIGADLRKPKIRDYINTASEIGLTNYLVDENLKISDLIISDENTNFDFLTSGEIPPNPTSLLMNGRFEKVLAFGKENYDYVIVDTPPVSLVTDTLLLSHHADLFIYVIRVNYLDKRLLKVPKNMFENKRLPNMALLLNDTNYKKSGYGYAYGYSD
jgi:tyrosine-protein kinase Etk/Wzc